MIDLFLLEPIWTQFVARKSQIKMMQLITANSWVWNRFEPIPVRENWNSQRFVVWYSLFTIDINRLPPGRPLVIWCWGCHQFSTPIFTFFFRWKIPKSNYLARIYSVCTKLWCVWQFEHEPCGSESVRKVLWSMSIECRRLCGPTAYLRLHPGSVLDQTRAPLICLIIQLNLFSIFSKSAQHTEAAGYSINTCQSQVLSHRGRCPIGKWPRATQTRRLAIIDSLRSAPMSECPLFDHNTTFWHLLTLRLRLWTLAIFTHRFLFQIRNIGFSVIKVVLLAFSSPSLLVPGVSPKQGSFWISKQTNRMASV